MTSHVNEMPFGDVLEAVDRLSLEEQAELAMILQHRLSERGRKQSARDVQEARQELAQGGSRPVSVDELMGELLS